MLDFPPLGNHKLKYCQVFTGIYEENFEEQVSSTKIQINLVLVLLSILFDEVGPYVSFLFLNLSTYDMR